MNKLEFSIDYVSNLLNVNKSTLRFWEEKNLIKINRSENGYRFYSLRDIINIADLIYYRDLGVPIKDIPRINSISINQQDEYLEKYLKKTKEQLIRYNNIIKNIENKKNQINKIKGISNNEYKKEDISFENVIEFNINDEKLIRRYSQNTSSYVRYYNSVDLKVEKRGLIVQNIKPDDLVLWKNDMKSNNKFIVFLVKELVEENYKSDLPEQLKNIKKEYNTGAILLEYLTTATNNGKLIDYYKAYLEIFNKI